MPDGDGDGGEVVLTGGYSRGVFVRAARGSSVDVGLFHDEQKRSVATVEAWVNAINAGGGAKVGVGSTVEDC